MKDIEEMSLQELYEEKEKIMKTLFLVGATYKMERVLKINEQIKKLELKKKDNMGS